MARDADDVREALRAFIASALIRDAGYPLTDAEPIISGGLIDSFALAELAVFIERRFAVYIPDPELTVERMDTLDQIVACVVARQAGQASSREDAPPKGTPD